MVDGLLVKNPGSALRLFAKIYFTLYYLLADQLPNIYGITVQNISWEPVRVNLIMNEFRLKWS